MSVRVLLLNPPGKRLYVRDYYCSKVSRSNYLYHPVDLLMLSGRLSERFEVNVIDAVADRVGASACRARIDALSPDVIISVIGAVSLEEDCIFLSGLHKAGRRIMVSGDVVLDDTAQWLRRHPYVDAAIVDFTAEGIIPCVAGGEAPFEGIVTQDEAGSGELPARQAGLEFSLPVPRHDLFDSRHYRFPFVRHREFATVLTDYGCPHNCSFCVMGTVGYKYRALDNVIDELRFLKRIGKKDIFFIDQTFGALKKRGLELCRRMCDEGFGFGWTCFTRADLVTDETLAVMRQAGCNTVIMGVETSSDDILSRYRKGLTTGRIRQAFDLCRSRGVRTVATFVLGLPEETEATARQTIVFARELGCDFASFSIAVPRMRTRLRDEAIRDSLIAPDLEVMDQTGTNITMPTKHLTKDQLRDIMDRAVREFYLRPGYLLRRAAGIRTAYELREQVAEGCALLRNICDRRREDV